MIVQHTENLDGPNRIIAIMPLVQYKAIEAAASEQLGVDDLAELDADGRRAVAYRFYHLGAVAAAEHGDLTDGEHGYQPDLFNPNLSPVEVTIKVLTKDGELALFDAQFNPSGVSEERRDMAVDTARTMLCFTVQPPNYVT